MKTKVNYHQQSNGRIIVLIFGHDDEEDEN